MSTPFRVLDDIRVPEIAEELASRGWQVIPDPDPSLFPFDTDGYRPSLLARKGSENVMVEVRTRGRLVSTGRFVDVAREVRRHAGWRFVRVTPEDVDVAVVPEGGDPIPTWEQLEDRIARAERLYGAKEVDRAFLSLWIALEGMLRREAVETAIPIERMATRVLLDELYSYGDLGMEWYDGARALLEVRDRVIHGFRIDDLDEAVPRLLQMVREMIAAWAPSRQAA
jgi:hypothetical protein